jgi:hypothetical protein
LAISPMRAAAVQTWRLRHRPRERYSPEAKGTFRPGAIASSEACLEEGITLPIDRLLAIATRSSPRRRKVPPGRRTRTAAIR